MDESQYIARLVQKYLKDALSAEERAYFDNWLASDPAHQAYVDSLTEDRIHQDLQHYKPYTSQAWIQSISHKVFSRIHPSKPGTNHRLWQMSAAAILIAAIAIALYFYRSDARVNQEILPGYNQATLTLADGTKINLDSAKAGIQINDEDILYNDGTIVNRNSETTSASGAIVNIPMLSLSTPKGGQYQIILEDGTKVWLNAASTLKYPSRFSGDKREVFLEGEAFFEVNNRPAAGARSLSASGAMSRVPFIVKSKNQEITVLGTSFNISSYEGEESVKTTLVTGAVRIQNSAGASVSLVPNEQSNLQPNGNLTKAKVDVDSELAWKNNKFSFDNKPFTQIMDEMARWYNFEVVYEGTIPNNRFMGDAYRTDNLSTVLQFLESSHGIGYRVESTGNNGHRLVIINKKGGKP